MHGDLTDRDPESCGPAPPARRGSGTSDASRRKLSGDSQKTAASPWSTRVCGPDGGFGRGNEDQGGVCVLTAAERQPMWPEMRDVAFHQKSTRDGACLLLSLRWLSPSGRRPARPHPEAAKGLVVHRQLTEELQNQARLEAPPGLPAQRLPLKRPFPWRWLHPQGGGGREREKEGRRGELPAKQTHSTGLSKATQRSQRSRSCPGVWDCGGESRPGPKIRALPPGAPGPPKVQRKGRQGAARAPPQGALLLTAGPGAPGGWVQDADNRWWTERC